MGWSSAASASAKTAAAAGTVAAEEPAHADGLRTLAGKNVRERQRMNTPRRDLMRDATQHHARLIPTRKPYQRGGLPPVDYMQPCTGRRPACPVVASSSLRKGGRQVVRGNGGTSKMNVRRGTSTVAAAMAAVLALAGTAIAADPNAINWGPPTTLRSANGVELQDADFSKRNVAVAWQEPGSGGPRVRIRTSVASGNAFGPITTFPDARHAAVDICATELHAVYAAKSGSSTWGILQAVGSVDTTGFVVSPVSGGAGVARFPDVACAGGRVFVSWYQKEGANDRLLIAHAKRSGGVFSAPIDLGVDDGTFFERSNSLAVAGVPGTAYAAFTRSDGQLRFKRWTIGPGPGFAVTPHSTHVIGSGITSNKAADTVIAAAGDKVAVAWFRCNAIYARVSNDRGAHWGPVRKLIQHQACTGDFGAIPMSIAIHGNKIVVTYLAFGLGSPGWVGVFRTADDFATNNERNDRPHGP